MHPFQLTDIEPCKRIEPEHHFDQLAEEDVKAVKAAHMHPLVSHQLPHLQRGEAFGAHHDMPAEGEGWRVVGQEADTDSLFHFKGQLAQMAPQPQQPHNQQHQHHGKAYPVNYA